MSCTAPRIAHSSSDFNHLFQLSEMDTLHLRSVTANANANPHDGHLRDDDAHRATDSFTSFETTHPHVTATATATASDQSGAMIFSGVPHGINVTSVRSPAKNYQYLHLGGGRSGRNANYTQVNVDIPFNAHAHASRDRESGSKTTTTNAARAMPSSTDSPTARFRAAMGDTERENTPAHHRNDSGLPESPDVQPGFVKQRLEELSERQLNPNPNLSTMHALAKSSRPSAFRPVLAYQQVDSQVSRPSDASQHEQAAPTANTNGSHNEPVRPPVPLRRSYDPLFTATTNNQLNPNASETSQHVARHQPAGHVVERPPTNTSIRPVYFTQSSSASTHSSTAQSHSHSTYAQTAGQLSPNRAERNRNVAAFSQTGGANVSVLTPNSPRTASELTTATPTKLDRAIAHHRSATTGARDVAGSGVSSIDSGIVSELSQSRVSLTQFDQKTYFENMLREKNLEVQQLRNTMEKNEEAMTRVFESRKQEWYNEYEALRSEADRRLALERERSAQFEQQVHFLTAQLEQVQNTLSSNSGLSHRVQEMSQSNRNFAQQLDNVKWALQQKQGELALLRTQYKECQNESQTARQHAKQLELLNAQLRDERSQLESKVLTLERATKQLTENIEHANRDLSYVRPSKSLLMRVGVDRASQTGEIAGFDPQTIQRAALLEQELKVREQEFEHERSQWLEEKTKVISYQKQLQLNLMQMSQRNKRLEADLQQMQNRSDIILTP